jgi:sugar lactone lactonase YvrE
VVKTPASQPTCVAFGGDDLSLMFVTSASEDLTPEQLAVESGSGDVFVFDVGVKGLPEVEFRADG